MFFYFAVYVSVNICFLTEKLKYGWFIVILEPDSNLIQMHAMRLGPGKHLQGRTLMNGLVKPEEFDYFHELIITQEATRCGARGYGDGEPILLPASLVMLTLPMIGLLGGAVIGLPPVLNFGSDELKARIVPDVFAGKKFICLAISEAHAGSDVMGLQTTAVKSEDGKEWIINGRCTSTAFEHHHLTV